MKKLGFAVLAAVLAGPVFADGHAVTGNAEAGETLFNRQCVACHVVADANGNVLAGRSARTGPNLFQIAGRDIASHDGFRYSDSIEALGETGMTWSEDRFGAFIQDPTGWLWDTLDDGRARSKMAYRVRAHDDAMDIYAYLVSLGVSE